MRPQRRYQGPEFLCNRSYDCFCDYRSILTKLSEQKDRVSSETPDPHGRFGQFATLRKSNVQSRPVKARL
jgi:hypothetical protein